MTLRHSIMASRACSSPRQRFSSKKDKEQSYLVSPHLAAVTHEGIFSLLRKIYDFSVARCETEPDKPFIIC